MFDNLFLNARYEGDAPDGWQRLYLRFEQLAGDYFLFDSVSADFIDELPEIDGLAGWSKFSSRAPTFILETQELVFLPFILPEDHDDVDDDAWYEVHVLKGGKSRLYYTLFGQSMPVKIRACGYAPANAMAKLSKIFDLTPHERTSQDIQDVLDTVTGTIDWVSVYDVGQGNANGLCDATETPLAYFDLGGGVGGNSSTFPTAFADFCYVQDPPVILSHWDWDHWSSGALFSGAQALKWIVPNQALGAAHSLLAAGLHSAGLLYVWPRNGVPHLTSGKMTVHRCTGIGAGRNHTGLAMEVIGPGGEDPILLTGDARYTAIPGAATGSFTSVIVPHHGADMSSRTVPLGPGNVPGAAHTAWSYGNGNSYSHPAPVTEQDHDTAQWFHSSLRLPSVDLATVNRVSPGPGQPAFGHIGLDWAGSALPGHSCGTRCSVELRQN